MHPPPHPPVFLPKITRIFGPLLLINGRALREPASPTTHFYWSTCGENRQPASICRQADHWGVSGDLIPSDQGLYYAKFWSLVSLTGWWAHQRISLFQFPAHFASKTVQWLNFNEKSENTNYSTLNACGLAIIFKFLTLFVHLTHWLKDKDTPPPKKLWQTAFQHSTLFYMPAVTCNCPMLSQPK